MKLKLNEVEKIIKVYRELQKISRSLRKLDVKACNYGLSQRDEKRQERLESQAEKLAQEIDLKIYHQTDPRGCSLYFIDDNCKYKLHDIEYINYPRGIAIY